MGEVCVVLARTRRILDAVAHIDSFEQFLLRALIYRVVTASRLVQLELGDLAHPLHRDAFPLLGDQWVVAVVKDE